MTKMTKNTTQHTNTTPHTTPQNNLFKDSKQSFKIKKCLLAKYFYAFLFSGEDQKNGRGRGEDVSFMNRIL